MGRRNIEERNIRKITKGTSSYHVTIPIEAMRLLGWQKGQKVVMEVDVRRDMLVVRDWKK